MLRRICQVLCIRPQSQRRSLKTLRERHENTIVGQKVARTFVLGIIGCFGKPMREVNNFQLLHEVAKKTQKLRKAPQMSEEPVRVIQK